MNQKQVNRQEEQEALNCEYLLSEEGRDISDNRLNYCLHCWQEERGIQMFENVVQVYS